MSFGIVGRLLKGVEAADRVLMAAKEKEDDLKRIFENLGDKVPVKENVYG